MDVLTSASALRRWSVANLIANMVIIWTGALVRLTKSGLGCPTWPQCEPGSYVPTGELGLHGAIEFGNRMLTFVLAAIALATFLAAWRRRRAGQAPRRLVWLTFSVGLGIIAQAVIGGVSVRMQLDPWVVGLHMVASVALILVCVEIVHLTFGVARVYVPQRLALLTQTVFLLGLAVIALGVVVTGAGPHSGDGGAQRNGLSPEWTAKTHAWSVWLLIGLTVLGSVLAWADPRLRRLWLGLLAVELLQGLIGYIQYFTHLPVATVMLHMVGTTLFVAALGHLTFLTRHEALRPAEATARLG
ncbi:MAG: COX15/CtaA family protein [Nigerium sp.]|nr:COX15/CtaA family protein [Nigerium sp.]